MVRMLQDIRLGIGGEPDTVLWAIPITGAGVAENLAKSRMVNRYADRTSKVEGVRVLDANGEEEFRLTVSDLLNAKRAEVGT